ETEGDVVRLAQVLLIEPITQVLHVLYPEGWKVHSEYIYNDDASSKQDELVSDDQKKKISVPRYDLVFRTVGPNGKKGKAIAVVEYKRPGLVQYTNFEHAMISTNVRNEENAFKKLKAEAEGRPKRSMLWGNALPYVRQVSKYAIKSGCHHLALFNPDHLIVLYFNELNMTVETAGLKAQVSWISELQQGTSTNNIQNRKIRLVLLGWLLNAFTDILG
ncbi:hypothetical protein EK21DRAFT_28972, partial [Setomelanomma holmii]